MRRRRKKGEKREREEDLLLLSKKWHPPPNFCTAIVTDCGRIGSPRGLASAYRMLGLASDGLGDRGRRNGRGQAARVNNDTRTARCQQHPATLRCSTKRRQQPITSVVKFSCLVRSSLLTQPPGTLECQRAEDTDELVGIHQLAVSPRSTSHSTVCVRGSRASLATSRPLPCTGQLACVRRTTRSASRSTLAGCSPTPASVHSLPQTLSLASGVSQELLEEVLPTVVHSSPAAELRGFSSTHPEGMVSLEDGKEVQHRLRDLPVWQIPAEPRGGGVSLSHILRVSSSLPSSRAASDLAVPFQGGRGGSSVGGVAWRSCQPGATATAATTANTTPRLGGHNTAINATAMSHPRCLSSSSSSHSPWV